MREAELQKLVMQALEKSGWLVVKIIQCNKNGWPDLLALKDSKAVFIEVKQLGKHPAELQLYRIEKLIKQGFEAFVCDKVEQIEHLCQ